MAQSPPVHDIEPAATLRSWLDRPLSNSWCVVGWLVSTAVFVAIVQLLGGPSYVDSAYSTNSALAMAHGQFACAFPRGPDAHLPALHLWVSGDVGGCNVGHGVPFPATTASVSTVTVRSA